MKDSIVLISRNRPMQEGTASAVKDLQDAGAMLVESKGTTGLSLSRNIALTQVCRILDELANSRSVNDVIVLMVDDDMLFTVSDAQTLINLARKHQSAVSGWYVDAKLENCARVWRDRWVNGLGFMAIPALELFALRSHSQPFKGKDCILYQFCWEGVEDGEWVSEDYRLCRELGGVNVIPLRIGHIKPIPLYPAPQDQLAAFIMNVHKKDGQ